MGISLGKLLKLEKKILQLILIFLMKVAASAILVAILCFNHYCLCDFTPSLVIDTFDDASPSLRVITQRPLPNTVTSSDTNLTVPGGVRDMILAAESGLAGNIMTSAITDGVWTSHSSGQASGFTSVQYDATPGSQISRGGLGCLDLTDNSNAEGFALEAQSDQSTDFKIFVYDNFGGVATISRVVDTNEQSYYYMPFDEFLGSVDFTCAGAIELTATLHTFHQFSVNELATGKYVSSVPSVSPSPSPSRTPTSTPSRLIEEPECRSSSDCPQTQNECQVVECLNEQCVYQVADDEYCCFGDGDDCPAAAPCTQWIGCSDYHCNYVNIACIDSNSIVSPGERTSDFESIDDGSIDDGSNTLIIILSVLIPLITCFICAIAIVAIVIVNKKRAKKDNTSVYDAMISDYE